MRTQDKDVKGIGRIIRGTFSPSGGILAGTGFRVVKLGTGLFQIFPNEPMKGLPWCSATADSSGGYLAQASYNDKYGISVNCFVTGGGALRDPIVSVNFLILEMIPS